MREQTNATRRETIRRLAVLALLLAAGTFHVGTIRQGYSWNGDFALYILHAKNIVHGADYQSTGYIYNPLFPEHSPRTYPPVFPLLLSTIYKWFGMNLTAMKAEVAVFFLLSLWMLFLIFERRLPFSYLFAALTLVALSPVFWDRKDEVLPDVPFMFFVYLTVYLIDRAYSEDAPPKAQAGQMILIGIGIYLAYGTRSIGLVLIPALLTYDWMRERRLSRLAIGSVLTAVALIVCQNLLLHTDSSYIDQIRHKLAPLPQYVVIYIQESSKLWDNGRSRLIRYLLLACWTAVAAFGYYRAARRRPDVLIVLVPFYVLAVLAWPGGIGIRYLIPVLPLYFLYLVMGIHALPKLALRSACVALLATTAVSSYVGAYAKKDYGPFRDSVRRADFAALCEFVESHTKPGEVFVSENPRVLSLFAQRRSAVYPRLESAADVWRFFDDIRANYVVVSDKLETDAQFLRPVITRYQDRLQPVYRNSDFEVYHVMRTEFTRQQ